MTRVVTLKINDQDVSGREDESILSIALENNIWMCLVEVQGSTRLFPACTTYPQEGMQVFTNTDRLKQHRKMIIEMLFSEGNHVCSVCVVNGHCDLQYLANRLGVDHIRLPYLSPKRAVDASHGRFALDPNRCILCTRCVRVCEQIEGAQTWGVMDRGIHSHVITDMNQPWGDSETCTSCGKCVQVCPTGAIFEKGRAVGELTKRREFLPYLAAMRHDHSE
jgi:bidirectional [NiFe] hydrogenase diaphorase subunit